MYLHSSLTAPLLVLTLLSYVSAQTPVAPTGSGSQENPYQISSLDNLAWVSVKSDSWSSHFIQTADIDASPSAQWNSGSGWKPIGTISNPFTGTYNGNGHIISNLAFKRDSSLIYLGMFGRANGSRCEIRWLGLTGIDFTMKTKGSGSYTSLDQTSIGGIAGRLSGHARINGCYAEGSMAAPIARVSIGGIAGTADSSNIATCYSNCTITTISPSDLGGLIGYIIESSMMNSYSSSRFVVDKMDKYWFGGLAGYGYVIDIKNCFWDIETSGIDTSRGGGSGKTTAQMQTQATYYGWDFVNTWSIKAGEYPHLRKPATQKITQPSGTGTENDPYLISSLDNLLWLTVNIDQWNKYYRQTAPIDASETGKWESGYGWSPVGTEEIPFTGGYDGGGFTISGLTVNRPVQANSGFFGKVSGKTSYLKNISLSNATINGSRYVGAIAGSTDTTRISQCTSLSTNCSAANAFKSNLAFIGGVTGYSRYTAYKSCTFIGKLYGDSARSSLGGLIGSSANDSVADCKITPFISMAQYNSNVGGLVGNVSFITVSRCTTECAINVNESSVNIGGLIGYTFGGGSVKNCLTSGTIISNGTNKAGGIIGDNFGGTNIYQSGSAVSITATGYSITMGGLVGSNTFGNVSQCFSTGTLTGKATNNNIAGLVAAYSSSYNSVIADCYSLSPIVVYIPGTEPNAVSSICGLVGVDQKGIADCYSAGPITISGLPIRLAGEFGNYCLWDSEAAGAKVYSKGGFSTAAMKTKSTYTDSGWDFKNVWVIDPAYNNGYPCLKWQITGGTKQISQKYASIKTPVLFCQKSNTIAYTLFRDQMVSVKIYNLKGACIASLADKRQPAGQYTLSKFTDNFGSGSYMLLFKTDQFRAVKNFTIVR